ncbi:MAG TPA: HDIG domain-containing protein [Trueperaceae bacterium]|nr:HDIG domain-containing protein [Trueperaceae bacterium]
MPKPSAWYLNAARRTVRALVPGLAPPDDAFAASRLTGAEYGLYLRMDRRDRHHACEVAKELLARHPGASEVLVRAALLHDLGKADRPFRVLERVLVHLLPTRPLPPEPRLRGLAGAMQVKRHHQRYGADMIRAAGGSEVVARLVAGHHRVGGEAELLRRIDDET